MNREQIEEQQPPRNRESYLTQLMLSLAPLLEGSLHGATGTINTWRVSVGFPGGGSKRTRIGECWGHTASVDGLTEIFISPVLADPLKVAEVLLHEMIHAALGSEEGHGPSFKRLAREVGLIGPARATVAGEELKLALRRILDSIGCDYPHAELKLGGSAAKPQTTRLLKVACPSCSYTIRVTQVWIAKGLPTCYCGSKMTQSTAAKRVKNEEENQDG